MIQKIIWTNFFVLSLGFLAGNLNQWFIYSSFSDQIHNLSNAVDSLEFKEQQAELGDKKNE